MFVGTIHEEDEEEPDLCSSNHFILDRIAEKDKTDTGNLHRAGSEGETEPGRTDTADIRRVNNSLQVFIDGPFGAPTNLIFHAQHAVLIGTGIGVTPFASILQSIMHRYSGLLHFYCFYYQQQLNNVLLLMSHLATLTDGLLFV